MRVEVVKGIVSEAPKRVGLMQGCTYRDTHYYMECFINKINVKYWLIDNIQPQGREVRYGTLILYIDN